jgi:hypothetical protein
VELPDLKKLIGSRETSMMALRGSGIRFSTSWGRASFRDGQAMACERATIICSGGRGGRGGGEGEERSALGVQRL